MSSSMDTHRLKLALVVLIMILSIIVVYAFISSNNIIDVDLFQILKPPSIKYWFGTDIMGRDMWMRTVNGLILSLKIGIISAVVGGCVAIILAIIAGINSRCEFYISLLVDMFMSVPHLLLLIILTLALGGGTLGVILAVAFTHWPKLTRLLIEEVRGLSKCQFVLLAGQFGRPRWFILFHHVLPFLLPHIVIGILLIIPHALIHVASLTFLGFGLEPTTPSIGILLFESNSYILSGHWWLGVFPGLALFIVLLLLSALGQISLCLFKNKGY